LRFHVRSLTFNQKDKRQSNWIRQNLGKEVSVPTLWRSSTQSFGEASLPGLWGMNPFIWWLII